MNTQATPQAFSFTTQTNAVTSGKVLSIGQGFNARSYQHSAYAGLMDPLVMVDHYRMTTPTFGAHPHVGLCAVSLIFEDSSGSFRNLDSLGNDIDLAPGDVYWLSAGKGVIHDEYPRPGADIHGLQVFVNTPQSMKQDAPRSLHVKASQMPVIEDQGRRIRVVLGQSNRLQSLISPTTSMTIIDGFLEPGAHFEHLNVAQQNLWLIVIDGELTVNVQDNTFTLNQHETIALKGATPSQHRTINLKNVSSDKTHFVLFGGQPIHQDFVQRGPFIMTTTLEIEQAQADYNAGKFGALPPY